MSCFQRDGGKRFIGSGGGGGGGSGGTQQQRKPDRQVTFTQPFPDVGGRVAIIGGGLSGLSCAQQLAARGIESCVFDTGEHGVGGRLATRVSADGSLPSEAPQGLVFDHAAQFFTVSDPRFARHVKRWQAAGAVKRWGGPVGSLCADGTCKPVPSNDRYVAVGGMRSLAEHLVAEAVATGLVEVRRPLWVSSARFDRRGGSEGWRLAGRNQDQGALFDALVIAHNGK